MDANKFDQESLDKFNVIYQATRHYSGDDAAKDIFASVAKEGEFPIDFDERGNLKGARFTLLDNIKLHLEMLRVKLARMLLP